MSRKRNPKRDEAFEIWKRHKGEITNRAIAEQIDVPEKTISAWKSRDKWSAALKTDDCSTTKKKRSTTTKKSKKEAIVESDDLTDKQRLFCIYYIKYFNATKAYQKAYECNYMTANANGSRLLVNASIRGEITRMKKERASGLLLGADEVLQKYIDIAFADVTDFVGFGSEEVVARNEFGDGMTDDDGKEITYTHNFVNFKNADEVDGTIITEVKKGKDGISVKLADKMKAMEMLAKFTDLLSDNDKKRLQEEKLKAEIIKVKAEIIKVKAETNTDETGEGKTIIVTGEDEMRRVLDGKSSEN